MARHFATHCNDLPCVVDIDGNVIRASKGTNTIGKEFLEAGTTLEYALSIWIPSSELNDRPKLKSRIIVDGKEYRIGNVEEYADGAGWRVDLGHPEEFSL